MTPDDYSWPAQRVILVLTAVFFLFGLSRVQGQDTFLSFSLAPLWTLGTVVAAVIVGLFLRLVTALAARQPTWLLSLLVGFGLLQVPVLLLWLYERTLFESWWLPSLIACFWAYPVIVGTTGLHGVNARRLLGRVNWAVAAVIAATLWSRPLEGVIALAVVGSGIWLAQQLPGEPQTSAELRRNLLAASALGLAVFFLLPVAGNLGRNKDGELALKTYRERYPEVQVGKPKTVPAGPLTIVEVPSADWTFWVVIERGKVVDDGFGKRAAARITADWLAWNGISFLPIEPGAVVGRVHWSDRHSPFRDSYYVGVRLAEPGNRFFDVLVHKGRVVYADGKPPGPLSAEQVAELINSQPDPEFPGVLVRPSDIRAAWDHGSGLWEYSFRIAFHNGYVLVRDGKVERLRVQVEDPDWPPPHSRLRGGASC